MTTVQQFEFYKGFAQSIFQYCISKNINRFVNCTLEVDYCDYVNNTLANLRKPNKISLHIDNIINECGGNGNRINDIVSLIFIAITHELMHVEQLISQETYISDQEYRKNAEYAVNSATYNFLAYNQQEINRMFGIQLNLSYLEDEPMKDYLKQYQTCNVRDMYRYSLLNILFRSNKKFKEFDDNVLSKYDTIRIIFKNGDNFLIKSNGEFCDYNLNSFVTALGAYAGSYDCYTVEINVTDIPNRDKGTEANVLVTLSNRKRRAMYYNI